MAKVYTYFMILAAVEVLLTFGGIGIWSSLLNNFAFAGNWATSLTVLSILGFIGGLAVGGVITAGIFGRTISESYFLAPISFAILGIFIADAVSIVSYVNTAYPDMSFLGNIIGGIFFIITVGFTIAMVQWFRGNDI